jgi:ligand-binding sensor domain-containing protein
MDGRNRWSPVLPCDWPVYALADLGGDVVLAGTRGGGVLRSADGGASWTASNDGLPDRVVHVLIDTGGPGVVLAGTGRGVARSVDGGRHWTPVGVGLADHRIFSLTTTGGGTVLAGSYDGVWSLGAGDPSWVAVNTGLSVGESFAVGVTARGEVLTASQGDVQRSRDRGATWEASGWTVGAGGAGTVYGFCIAESGEVYAGTDDGVRRRSPGTGHWVHDGLAGVRVYRILEAGPDLLLAGTLGHGAVRREANGVWEPANSGLGHPMVFDVMRSRQTGHLFAGSGDLADGAKTGGIFRSLDRGRTWAPMDVEPITVYRVDETSDGVMVAGAQRSCVLRSYDQGVTWQASRPHGCDNSKTYCLFIDGSDRLYLGSGARLLGSDNRGESWRVIGDGLDGVTVYAMAEDSNATLYAATSSGPYRSDDHGRRWTALPWPPDTATRAG